MAQSSALNLETRSKSLLLSPSIIDQIYYLGTKIKPGAPIGAMFGCWG